MMKQQGNCPTMKTKQRWTNKEIERVRELVGAGKEDDEIGAILGRTKQAVFNVRKYKLGIHIRQHWSAAEEARLEQLLTTTDKPLSEIARLMDRTEGSIERRKEHLGIRRVPFKLDKLNPSHVAQLIKFKMMGWTQEKIAVVWGIKNPAQISNVLRHHGLYRFYACVGEKGYQRWSNVELYLLRKCVQKGLSRKEICKEFPHRSPSAVSSKVRRLIKEGVSPVSPVVPGSVLTHSRRFMRLMAQVDDLIISTEKSDAVISRECGCLPEFVRKQRMFIGV